MESYKFWFIAMRPWSFTAAIIPLFLGIAFALLNKGTINPILALCTVLGGISLQAACNIYNTYGDFISGVDTIESAVTCPQLATGQSTPKAFKRMGHFMLFISACLGTIIFLLTDTTILIFALVGFLGVYGYTTGPKPFKYLGIGPFFVFFLMGPFMTLPAYYIQTGQLSFQVFIASLPIAFLVSAIMQANDLRDMQHDKNAGILTLALILGEHKARLVYIACFIAACLSIVFSFLWGFLPFIALLPLILIPFWIKNVRAILQSKETLIKLEGFSAQFHMAFGSLYIIGIGISALINIFT